MSARSPLARTITLLRSPLAVGILLAFFSIAIVESVFLGALTVQILETDKQAERQYRLLKIAKDLSEAVQSAGLSWAQMDLVRKDPTSEGKSVFFHATVGNVYKKMDQLGVDLESVGIKTDAVKQAKADFKRIETLVTNLVNVVVANPGAQVDYDKVRPLAGQMFVDLLTNVNSTFALVQEQVTLPYKDPDIRQLFYLAIAVNIAMLVALAFAVERGITRPIRQLAESCSRITSGELMQKPGSVRNEIGSLKLSFYNLSAKIQENDTRRRSNLELLQQMQAAALERVTSCFKGLLSLQGVSDKAAKKFNSSLSSLSALNQLLDTMTAALQKGGSTELVVHAADTSSSKLLDAAVSSTESLVSKNRINLVRTESESFALKADQQLIVRVLINFLSNAIKYSPAGGRIDLVVANEGNMLRFFVKDEGPGISEEGQKKLFSKFGQVEAADGIKRAGTGLGLMICKEIVEKHGGEIGCESEVGSGSKFWFTLPNSSAPASVASSAPLHDIHPPVAENASVGASSEIAKTKKSGQSDWRKGGLKKVLGLMLVAFLLPQILVAINFQFKFQQIASGARKYHELKGLLFRVEEVYFSFLTWRTNVAMAAEKEQISEIPKAFAAYKDVVQKTKWVKEHTKEGSFVNTEIVKIMDHERSILKMLRGFLSNPNSVQGLKGKGIKPLKADMSTVDEGLNNIMEVETGKLKSQYTLSNKLREEILISLALAAFLNVCVLVAVSIMGLKIIEKISAIQLKSVAFGTGQNIEETIVGDDELTYLDKRLVEACHKIKEAQAEQQALMSVINHDLRTPLASILSVLEMTAAGVYVPLTADIKETVGAANREVRRLLARVTDLLDLEKLDAGAYDLQADEIALKDIIEKVVEEQRALAVEKDLSLELNMPADLNAARVAADRTLLERAFSVVIENAISAEPRGGRIEVELVKSELENEQSGVTILVTDHGSGIDEKLLAQIFQRFRSIEGKPLSGLGLPLAERITKLHGGEIDIDSSRSISNASEKNFGTRVRFQFPISLAKERSQIESEVPGR
ncbi:MAG: HAMP domain-containing histidine kinase [Candidatus Obscuribacterales bacterium]|nr:HAMP domain-containing histidine kinase [Candidatus Obscuribacterales bacterium]